MLISDFKKVDDYLWEIPKDRRRDMLVPARVYATEEILEASLQDRSLQQLVNLTTLPGIERYAIAMPDIHEGYGSPIGGVVATDANKGVISPGVGGYDINCGMRLFASSVSENEAAPHLEELAGKLQREIPSGLGKGRKLKFNSFQMNLLLEKGVDYLIEEGYGTKEEAELCEEKGRVEDANPSAISEKAKKRGADQVGTLGSGNHFLEIQKVEEVFAKEEAETMGVFKGQIMIMVHSGSRGLGHQVASENIDAMGRKMRDYGITVPDKELVCAPFLSKEGKEYKEALSGAMNYAFANRHMIGHFIHRAWEKVFEKEALNMIYDVAHNTVKLENHYGKKLLVHRKGATEALPPGDENIPEKYKKTGQPVIIPGSMGTASYLLCGAEKARETFYSVSHGAGRKMSRKEAVRRVGEEDIVKELKKKGIIIKSFSKKGIAEEVPFAYKDINKVVNVICGAGLAKKVAKIVPLFVIKGE